MGFAKFPDRYCFSEPQVGCCSTLSPSGTHTSSLQEKDQESGQ